MAARAPSSFSTLRYRWAASSLALADGATVTSWSDLVASIALAEATNPPTYRASVANFNRKPGVEFTTGKLLTATGLFDQQQPNAWYVVIDDIAGTGNAEILKTSQEIGYFNTGIAIYGGSANATGDARVAGLRIVIGVWNGASSVIYWKDAGVPGALKSATASIGTFGTGTTLTLAHHPSSSWPDFSGRFAEVGEFSAALTAQDAQDLYDWLAQEYGTAWSRVGRPLQLLSRGNPRHLFVTTPFNMLGSREAAAPAAPAGGAYPIANSTTTGDRLAAADKALVHLSDGTAVFVYYDGGSWILAYSSDHANVSTITTLSGLPSSTTPINIFLAVDASDNLYVCSTDSSNTKARVQGFSKGSGYTWTAQTALIGASALNAGLAESCIGALWCNTGGGTSAAGHLLLIFAPAVNGSSSPYAICDAGAALAGTGTLVTNQAASATFLTASTTAPGVGGGQADLVSDGRGVANGICICMTTTTAFRVGAWAVNSSGALSTNSSIGPSTNFATGVAGSTTKYRTVRTSSNLYTVIYPSTVTATHLMAARFSATAQLTAGVDWGTPTNAPLNGQKLAWDAFADPTVADKVWVVATAAVAAGSQAVWRVGASVASGVTWDAAATAVDTITPVNTSGDDLRVVSQPVGALVDWQDYEKPTATTFALDGGAINLRTGQLLVRVAGTFVHKPTLVRVGGTFVSKPLQVRVGGAFQNAT